jgi:threonine dehydratase
MTKYQIPDNALPAFTELSKLSTKETEKKSSVMTDMRLLFNDELVTAPTCGVILHQLKIDYIENGEQKSFFLSMDKDDVTEMCNVLKRALKKEDIILKNQSDIHFITLK